MALPLSPLSVLCSHIAEFVKDGLAAPSNNISVFIGAPAEAANKDKNKHRVNLFFYRFAPAGFGPGPAMDEPWLIRMHCLITVFGVDEDTILAGENELRLLGEILRILHENPVLDAVDVAGRSVRLQVIFEPLGSDDLNHIWSTQGDLTYRPSLAYEMALVPVMPSTLAPVPRLVGAIGMEARGTMDARHEPFTGAAHSLPVKATSVDTRVNSWAPQICFVHQNTCVQAMALAVGSEELDDFDPPAVWIAGDPGATVTLRWEEWNASTGWSEAGGAQDVSPVGTRLDPEQPIPAGLPTMALPFTDHPGQAVLYATRSYIRGSDGATIEVRSNPLLVTLY